MNIGKICDYLYDIGVLDVNSIEDFLLLHENISRDSTNNNSDNLALTLNLYLTQKFNSKQGLVKLSENIINSFSNHIVINRYNRLKILYNILLSKMKLRYTLFFSKINFFIYKKYISENIKQGKIIKRNKGNKNNNDNINENMNSDKENNIIQNERKLNYDYNLYELSNKQNDDNENKNNEKEENKKEKEKENYRYYYNINIEEFYEEEKRYQKKVEESKAKLEKEKQKEYLLRCPFFPLLNSNSRKLSKKRLANDKKRIGTAFSCDKNVPKKEVFNKIIKEFSPNKNKEEIDYNYLEKKRLKEMEEKIKEEKIKKEKKKEEMLKNIENTRPKVFSKETMIRLATPAHPKKSKDNDKNKEQINKSKSSKKKNNKEKKNISPKKKEKEKREDKPKKKEEKKEEEKNEEEKKEEDKKEEEKQEEEEKRKIQESNISSSLDINRLIEQCNDNLLSQVHQMGGFQSEAINHLINKNI